MIEKDVKFTHFSQEILTLLIVKVCKFTKLLQYPCIHGYCSLEIFFFLPRSHVKFAFSLFPLLFIHLTLSFSFFCISLSLSLPLINLLNTTIEYGDDMGSSVCWGDLESSLKVIDQSYWWIGFLGFYGSSC